MKKNTISIRNLNDLINSIQNHANEVCKTQLSGNPGVAYPQKSLREEISNNIERVEQNCHNFSCYPADMTDSSYRAYLWLVFLSKEHNLEQHLAFLHHFLERWKAESRKAVSVDLYNSAMVFQCKSSRQNTHVTLNEGFIKSTPAEVETLLACCLHSTQKNLGELRSISRAASYQRIMAAMWQHTPQSSMSTKGEYYDLLSLFHAINRDYFHGTMKAPRLRWGGKKATRRLGYYHPDSDTITISPFLDQRSIPSYVMEYVLYHEMLHKKLGLKEVNSYRIAHTAQFKQLEHNFNAYQDAEAFLKSLQKR
ncbi:MAG TPA: hypothetical protein DCK95_06355 [Anaerolineaceae bacterium]|nr:hypothetical protein [Anaerolineaceae bacterium]